MYYFDKENKRSFFDDVAEKSGIFSSFWQTIRKSSEQNRLVSDSNRLFKFYQVFFVVLYRISIIFSTKNIHFSPEEFAWLWKLREDLHNNYGPEKILRSDESDCENTRPTLYALQQLLENEKIKIFPNI